MDSTDLKALYDRVYADGKEGFFTFSTADVTEQVLKEADWRGRSVLEVGCGTGETAFMIAAAGGRVLATDFVKGAIQEAQERHQHPNLSFAVANVDEVEGLFDYIVMQEVIEHVDDPPSTLARLKSHLKPDGHLIVTCPSFLNLRGVVWMTLQLLLDVPMSLTDRHFISPPDMEGWAKQLGLHCTWRTFRHSQGMGEQMLVDLAKRLPNALRDAGLDNSKAGALLDWLEAASTFELEAPHNGAKALYHLTLVAS